MKFQIPKGETSVILTVFIQDSSSSTGAGLSGLIHTSSITGGYVKRDGTGVALTVDEDVTTEGTYQAPSTAAKVRIGTPANMPAGFYELHFHNDLFTTADWVTMGFTGATNMAPLTLEIQLADVDLATAIPELGVAAPTATPTVKTGLMLMYMALRNKLVVQTSGTDAIEIYNDAGTKIAAKTITDDGSDYTEAEMA